MIPLRVTAALQQGVALDVRWPVLLDGVLAWEVLRREQGDDFGLIDLSDPGQQLVDPDLPLARCGVEDWHWCASTARPVGTSESDLHWFHSRFRTAKAEEVVGDGMPRMVRPNQGRYRSFRMPLVVTSCRGLEWHAVGDRQLVEELLTGIVAVGKKRSQGEGLVVSWRVEEALGTHPGWGHLWEDGSPARPIPASCPLHPGGDSVTSGIRPPYWHPSTQRSVAAP